MQGQESSTDPPGHRSSRAHRLNGRQVPGRILALQATVSIFMAIHPLRGKVGTQLPVHVTRNQAGNAVPPVAVDGLVEEPGEVLHSAFQIAAKLTGPFGPSPVENTRSNNAQRGCGTSLAPILVRFRHTKEPVDRVRLKCVLRPVHRVEKVSWNVGLVSCGGFLEPFFHQRGWRSHERFACLPEMNQICHKPADCRH